MLTSNHFDFVHFTYSLLNNVVYFLDDFYDLSATVKEILCLPLQFRKQHRRSAATYLLKLKLVYAV